MKEAINPNNVRKLQHEAEDFVNLNIHRLCTEMVAFDTSGLFGTGALHKLRMMCSFAGASAQSLAIGMVETAAMRAVAAPVTEEELVEAMEKWEGTPIQVDDQLIAFMNHFLRGRVVSVPPAKKPVSN